MSFFFSDLIQMAKTQASMLLQAIVYIQLHQTNWSRYPSSIFGLRTLPSQQKVPAYSPQKWVHILSFQSIFTNDFLSLLLSAATSLYSFFFHSLSFSNFCSQSVGQPTLLKRCLHYQHATSIIPYPLPQSMHLAAGLLLCLIPSLLFLFEL